MLAFEAKSGCLALLSALVGAAACGGRAQGGAPETTDDCLVDGEILENGQSIALADGCNTCTCEEGQLLCSQTPCPADNSCKDETCYPPGSCLSDGNLVLPGETILAADGCNTCSCQGGKMACTMLACGTGCHAPYPFDDLDCDNGERSEIFWYDAQGGYCRQREVVRCSPDLGDGYYSTAWECEEACPDDVGLGCVVRGELYPHGSSFTDPYSCNGCTCRHGRRGECTQGGCDAPCPQGTAAGVQCGICGADGRCEAIEITCLPPCGADDDAPCASGGCIDGLCVRACQ